MKNTFLLILFQLTLSISLFAQVGINPDNSEPDPSAMFDVKSTDKGMLIPRMATAERLAISSPATGLMLYDTDTRSFWYYNATRWLEIGSDLRSFQLQDGNQADGYVLTSDSEGLASWRQLDAGNLLGNTPLPGPDFSCMNQAGSLAIGPLPYSVAVSGNYAYVVDLDDDDLKVIDVSIPSTPTLVGSLAIGSNPLDLVVVGNYAYIVDSGSDDLKIIDVSNPASPSLAGSLSIGSGPNAIDAAGNYVYVVDTDNDDLRIIDVSNPASPSLTGSLSIGSLPTDVAVSGNYAYVTDTDSRDLKVIDVSDPANPSLTGSLNLIESTYSVALSGNYAIVGDDYSSLNVIDISDPANPSLTGTLTLGASVYFINLAVMGNYVYHADVNGNLNVIDISDPANPVLTETLPFTTPSEPNSIALSGNYAFLTDRFNDKIIAIDLSPCKVNVAVDPISGSLVAGGVDKDADPANELQTLSDVLTLGNDGGGNDLINLNTITATAFVGDGSGLTNLPMNGWSLTGNAGTDTTTNFIGTTDNMPLDFKVNNQRALRLIPASNSVNILSGYFENSVAGSISGATIAGGGASGYPNQVSNAYGAVSGGRGNTASGFSSLIGGGDRNEASGSRSTVGGGGQNNASAESATISGGHSNNASGMYSVVGGGLRNRISGEFSSIPGGYENNADGDYSFATGYRAKISAAHSGAFLFSDQNGFNFNSASANEFAVRATGGVRFVTNIDGSGNPTQTVSIDNTGAITATAFAGDGSALTNVPGDDLGNHTATQTLDMGGNDITNGGSVTATAFAGDGSALTNVPGDDLGNHTATQALDMGGNDITNGGSVTATAFTASSGNGPYLRLNQDGSIWPAYTWDITGNESNFFIRDVSGGSTLPFRIQPGSQSNRLTISGNNVGIGLTSTGPFPTATEALDVGGQIRMRGGAAAGYVPVSDTGGVMTWTDPATLGLEDNLGNHTATQALSLNGNYLSGDGDNEGVYVDATGKVGIGTSTPSEPLEVAGNAQLTRDDPQLVFLDDVGSSGTRQSSISTTMSSLLGTSTPASQKMNFNVSDNTASGSVTVMTLKGDGHVGIGTATPDNQLSVAGNVDITGNAGIGTATPQARLDVSATSPEIRITDGRTAWPQTAGEVMGSLSFYSDDVSNTGGGYVGRIQVVADNGTVFPDGKFLFQTGTNGILTTRMVIEEQGNVGIGTTNPNAPLHVQGTTTISSFSGSNNGGAWMKESSGEGNDEIDWANNAGSTDVSIYASGSIVADGEGVFVAATVNWSDERIKQIEGISDSKQDLAALQQIEITHYRRIDGGKPEKKAIAQQLREVFPQAVSLREGVIPSIYEHISDFSFDKDKGLLTIVTQAEHDLSVGDRIDYYTESEKFTQQQVMEVISGHAFVVEANEQMEQLFVFGKWVDDVHVVDYDAIAMLNVSATQELVRQVGGQQRIIEEQQHRIEEQNQRIIELEQHVSRIESLEALVEQLQQSISKGQGEANKSSYTNGDIDEIKAMMEINNGEQ